MSNLRKYTPPTLLLKALVSLAIAPALITTFAGAIALNKALAQSPATAPAFSLPNSLPSGTDIAVDGSSSMTVINQALKQRFEEKFPGTTVDLAATGTDEAIAALLSDKIQLAAIGRPLTDGEKAQGLTEVPISREKIAIVVGPNNPFSGSLTFDQFAKIFRGEITDWAQVGGQPGPIRLIDRPDFSDTRQALSQYEVFKTAPFETGATATQVDQDDTAAVVGQLGSDGIGYAIASQVLGQSNVKVLPMHDTLPDDPRYPFSQPRGYVYKGELSPGAQAFLGFATSAPGQEIVETAKAAEAEAVATASPGAAVVPSAMSPSASPTVEASPSPVVAAAPAPAAIAPFDWSKLWWLLVPLLGLPLLLAWLKGMGGIFPAAASRSRLILTPRNCRDAYAYWELTNADRHAMATTGGRPRIRLYDVTDINDMDAQTPHSVQDFVCDPDTQDLHIPVGVDDRDYVAELGYLSENDTWHRVLRSPHVRVPACVPETPNGLGAGAGVAAAGAAAGATALAGRALAERTPVDDSRIILTPRNDTDAYAYWEVPDAKKADLRSQGGRNLKLRVQDATEIDLDTQAPHSMVDYDVAETATDLHIPLPPTGRDYVAELGYVSDDNRWLRLARSLQVHIPSIKAPDAAKALGLGGLAAGVAGAAIGLGDRQEATPVVEEGSAGCFGEEVIDKVSDLVGDTTAKVGELKADLGSNLGAVIAGAGAAVAGAGAAVAGAAVKSGRDRLVGGNDQSGDDGVCRIILVPRSATEAYAYWEVSDTYKLSLRQQGGRKLLLRVHDATNLDIDHETPHSTQSYECSELDQDKHVPIPVSDRDYIADLGYLADDGRWLRIIRSFHVRVPA